MAQDGGLSRFQRRLRSIPAAVRAAVRPALVSAAEDMAATMRVLAPEDTGDLKRSIEVTGPGQATPAYSQPGGSMIVGETEAAVTAGNTRVRYAHLQEHGTTAHPAQPFFWPAVRLHRKRAAAKIKRAIGRAVRDSRKGGG